jgi:hypothetical protein
MCKGHVNLSKLHVRTTCKHCKDKARTEYNFQKFFLLLLFLIVPQGYHFFRIINNVGFAQIFIYTNNTILLTDRTG